MQQMTLLGDCCDHCVITPCARNWFRLRDNSSLLRREAKTAHAAAAASHPLRCSRHLIPDAAVAFHPHLSITCSVRTAREHGNCKFFSVTCGSCIQRPRSVSRSNRVPLSQPHPASSPDFGPKHHTRFLIAFETFPTTVGRSRRFAAKR